MSIVDLYFKRQATEYLRRAPWRKFTDKFHYDPSDPSHQSFAVMHLLENLGGGDPNRGLTSFEELGISPDVSVLGVANGAYGQAYMLSDDTVIKVAPAIEEEYIKTIKDIGIKSSMPDIYNVIDISTHSGDTDLAIHMQNAGRTIDSLAANREISYDFVYVAQAIIRLMDEPEKNMPKIDKIMSGDEFIFHPSTGQPLRASQLSDEEIEYIEQLVNSLLNWKALGIDIISDLHLSNVTIDESGQLNFIDFGMANTANYESYMDQIGKLNTAPVSIKEIQEMSGAEEDGNDQQSSYAKDVENYIYARIHEIGKGKLENWWIDQLVNQLMDVWRRYERNESLSWSLEVVDNVLAQASQVVEEHPLKFVPPEEPDGLTIFSLIGGVINQSS